MSGDMAPTAARRGWGRLALLALVALVVLVAASAVIFALHSLSGSPGSPPTAHGVGASGASATQTHTAPPTTEPTAAATATPSATAVPVITVTATELPHLTVNPTSINLGPCSMKTTSFTVSNSGGDGLSWTASSSTPLINLSRTNGTLSGGQDIQVTVQDTAASGKISVESPGVAGSPLTVNITCQGPV